MISYIKQLLKNSLLKVVIRLTKNNAAIKVNLSEKNIRNARLLENRIILLQKLPQNAVVAEIGVAEGDFSSEILKVCKPAKFHLIDCWDSARYHQGKLLVENKFASEIKNGTIQTHVGLSTEKVSDFPDAYFDWIYIDTDHTYHTTLAELRLYAPKVKKGGVIAGHDYVMGNWDKYFRYGVIEAVHQFCKEQNWEIIYLTMEGDNFPSFAIKQIEE